jgi:hypothetical protein
MPAPFLYFKLTAAMLLSLRRSFLLLALLLVIPEGNLRFAPIAKATLGREPL